VDENDMKRDEGKPTMEKQDRLDYLCAYFVSTIYHSKQTIGDDPTQWRTMSSYSFDCLHTDFVEDYLDVTNAAFKPILIGACPCGMLGSDLRALYDLGILKRWRVGVEAPTGGGGWPKWVWSYRLRPDAFPKARERAHRHHEKYPS
jgi:hypothetical protein